MTRAVAGAEHIAANKAILFLRALDGVESAICVVVPEMKHEGIRKGHPSLQHLPALHPLAFPYLAAHEAHGNGDRSNERERMGKRRVQPRTLRVLIW